MPNDLLRPVNSAGVASAGIEGVSPLPAHNAEQVRQAGELATGAINYFSSQREQKKQREESADLRAARARYNVSMQGALDEISQADPTQIDDFDAFVENVFEEHEASFEDWASSGSNVRWDSTRELLPEITRPTRIENRAKAVAMMEAKNRKLDAAKYDLAINDVIARGNLDDFTDDLDSIRNSGLYTEPEFAAYHDTKVLEFANTRIGNYMSRVSVAVSEDPHSVSVDEINSQINSIRNKQGVFGMPSEVSNSPNKLAITERERNDMISRLQGLRSDVQAARERQESLAIAKEKRAQEMAKIERENLKRHLSSVVRDDSLTIDEKERYIEQSTTDGEIKESAFDDLLDYINQEDDLREYRARKSKAAEAELAKMRKEGRENTQKYLKRVAFDDDLSLDEKTEIIDNISFDPTMREQAYEDLMSYDKQQVKVEAIRERRERESQEIPEAHFRREITRLLAAGRNREANEYYYDNVRGIHKSTASQMREILDEEFTADQKAGFAQLQSTMDGIMADYRELSGDGTGTGIKYTTFSPDKLFGSHEFEPGLTSFYEDPESGPFGGPSPGKEVSIMTETELARLYTYTKEWMENNPTAQRAEIEDFVNRALRPRKEELARMTLEMRLRTMVARERPLLERAANDGADE